MIFMMCVVYVCHTNEHFLKLHQEEVCLSVCYVFSSLSRVVCFLSWVPEAWSETLRKPLNVPTLTLLRPDNQLFTKAAEGYGLVMMMMVIAVAYFLYFTSMKGNYVHGIYLEVLWFTSIVMSNII